jgi:hypothetical protein
MAHLLSNHDMAAAIASISFVRATKRARRTVDLV